MTSNRNVWGMIKAEGSADDIEKALRAANAEFAFPRPEWDLGSWFSCGDGSLVIKVRDDLWEGYVRDIGSIARHLADAGMSPYGQILMETQPWAEPPRFARVDVHEDGTVEQKVGRIVYE